jgi:hypothetical protein
VSFRRPRKRPEESAVALAGNFQFDNSIAVCPLELLAVRVWRNEMEVWTGVACLVADPKCKDFKRFGDDGKGAYVNVAASVSSEAEFIERVERLVPTLDCILLELDDVQPLDKRMEDLDYPEELIDMRSTAGRQPSDLIFGTFHIWTGSDIN